MIPPELHVIAWMEGQWQAYCDLARIGSPANRADYELRASRAAAAIAGLKRVRELEAALAEIVNYSVKDQFSLGPVSGMKAIAIAVLGSGPHIEGKETNG